MVDDHAKEDDATFGEEPGEPLEEGRHGPLGGWAGDIDATLMRIDQTLNGIEIEMSRLRRLAH